MLVGMKFVIGTKNRQKIAVLKQIAAATSGHSKIEVIGVDVDSNVPDTPYGEETKQGAYNRAAQLVLQHPEAYAVGLESGLVLRYELLFEEAWACVMFGDKTYYGYSSGLLIPDYVRKRMAKLNTEHGPTMNKIRNELNQFDDRDTWGTYSGNMILRTISLEEALRNALIQIFAPEESLYHK